MDPHRPQRHGPYYKLAYVYRGKPVCRFVRANCLDQLRKRLGNYKTFRAIIDRWIALSIQRGKVELFGPRPAADKKSRVARRTHQSQQS
jgi:hypothetical protein